MPNVGGGVVFHRRLLFWPFGTSVREYPDCINTREESVMIALTFWYQNSYTHKRKTLTTTRTKDTMEKKASLGIAGI
jgi:hypothetical protein